MSIEKVPISIATELAALKHEKKNQALKRLPPNTTISRRPLHHPPVASPHAGTHVQKVVYISQRTPIMAAVKRVKKLLQHIEKRAVQGVNMKRQSHAQVMAELAEISDKLAKNSEEVLVKASGRAMGQALKVAEWFRSREEEILCKVEVRTGSVAAVDDIVEAKQDDLNDESANEGDDQQEHETTEESILTGGETTLELLGDKSRKTLEASSNPTSEINDRSKNESSEQRKVEKPKRRKRKKAEYDHDNLPEARIRWVKTIEVAISLRA